MIWSISSHTSLSSATLWNNTSSITFSFEINSLCSSYLCIIVSVPFLVKGLLLLYRFPAKKQGRPFMLSLQMFLMFHKSIHKNGNSISNLIFDIYAMLYYIKLFYFQTFLSNIFAYCSIWYSFSMPKSSGLSVKE